MGNVTDLTLPGTSGNYVSTPDSAGLSITGDIDIRVKVAPGTWNPPTSPFGLVSKYSNTSGQRSYLFQIANGGGALLWQWSADGATVNGGFGVCQSSVAPRTLFADGTAGWVRVTFEVNVAGAWRCTFYTSPDGTTWTQLGVTRNGAAASPTSLFDSTSKVALGTDREIGTQALWAGKYYKAEIRNGVGGTVVGSFDATAVTKTATRTPTTTTDAQGNVWTVNGSAWDWTAAAAVDLILKSARAVSRTSRPLLTQTAVLVLRGARSTSRAGRPTLAQIAPLSVHSARAVTRAGHPVLVQLTALVLHGARAAASASSAVLAQTSPLTIPSTRTATRATSPDLEQLTDLDAAGARAETRTSTGLLDQASALAVHAARAVTRSTSPALTQRAVLVLRAARAATRAAAARLTNPTTTPVERIYTVPAENRLYVVDAEDRTYTVPHENRTLTA